MSDAAQVRLGRLRGRGARGGARRVRRRRPHQPLRPPLGARRAAGSARPLPLGAQRHVAANRHFFAAIKDLEREPTRLEHVFEPVDDGGRELHVRLRSEAYAYFVHLAHPDERVRFSDNYLELAPGEERTVVLSHPDAAPRPQDVSVRAR